MSHLFLQHSIRTSFFIRRKESPKEVLCTEGLYRRICCYTRLFSVHRKWGRCIKVIYDSMNADLYLITFILSELGVSDLRE